ncbi:septal ring lytic transglycosylase RlpA family protein [Microcoleus sp. FACHB-672]|uniref:septal ring lytic transglycosylase RlpA family protein n=1 Tax=Microcoleus sp. FACHB-672 TaxID=2692825 RepID=UPI001689D7B2|nr:septal ring lytic transglycosylase RlpA family protein [Microcoleus sp. FACHB-672]MBD2041353.1 septal ring lytic transglycosylase RlpA family protein [Microcoleus sp. FACHB-672]
MNQRLWTSLTTALLMTAIWPMAYTRAAQTQTANKGTQANYAPAQKRTQQNAGTSPQVNQVAQYQPQANTKAGTAAIAKIYPHEVAGRQAATLYVRNIPILTFLSPSAGSNSASPAGKSGSKMGESSPSKTTAVRPANSAQNSTQPGSAIVATGKQSETNRNLTTAAGQSQQNDPIFRANAVAAKLNQLSRNSLDAGSITVTPDEGDTYLIKVSGKDLVAIDAVTMLANTTGNRAEDALQATNRLRRQMGNATPLAEIPGMPRRVAVAKPKAPEISTRPILYRLTGWASWYGPGFDGNTSASGEIFNQNDLTAAHRDLPFGTRVKVTNLDNGTSVIVRINDRGPFIEDRIIDLSAGAAEVLGITHSGVAPVSLEVLGSQNTAAVQ